MPPGQNQPGLRFPATLDASHTKPLDGFEVEAYGSGWPQSIQCRRRSTQELLRERLTNRRGNGKPVAAEAHR